MYQHSETQKIPKIIQDMLKRYHILFNWSYVELHILCMTGAKDKAIELALHMDRLGWLDVERKQMVIEKCGDIFTNKSINSCSEPIRVYAVQTLKTALRSKNAPDKEDIAELQQLCIDMKKLGWLNPNEYNKKQINRLLQLGIGINNS